MNKPKALYHHRHWWIYLTKGILWGLSKLPHRFLLILGSGIGFIVSQFNTKNNRIILRNLELCFPKMSDTERQRLARRCWQAHGMGIFEATKGWWGNKEKLRKICQIEGEKYLQAALNSGRGGILLTAHFTCSELQGMMINFLTDYNATAKHIRHPIADFEVYKARRHHIRQIFFAEEMKKVYQILKKGEMVAFLLDQDYGHKGTVFAPFFGVSTSTTTAISRIAKMTHSIVIPNFLVRIPGTARYRLIFQQPLENFPSDDPVKDAIQFNQVIENIVREYPEQYGWTYRRFATRPIGDNTDLYQ